MKVRKCLEASQIFRVESTWKLIEDILLADGSYLFQHNLIEGS